MSCRFLDNFSAHTFLAPMSEAVFKTEHWERAPFVFRRNDPDYYDKLFTLDDFDRQLSSSPAKKLILSATYANSNSNTWSNGISSANENNQFNTLIQYQVRKMSVVSGYSRLEQGFTGTGAKPEIISTYYMGLTRWFNIF